jgi:hypothetical protein
LTSLLFHVILDISPFEPAKGLSCSIFSNKSEHQILSKVPIARV